MDSYIAASFWLHLLCLYLTGTMIGNRNGRIRKRRLVTAALSCAVIDTVTIVVLSGRNEGNVPVLFIGVALIGICLGTLISFGKERIIVNGLLLFGVTALLAGFFQMVPIRNVGLFCLVGTVLLPLLVSGSTALFRRKQTQKWIYNAKLCQSKEEKCLSAFMDTGNRLRLYGSRVPVVLVDKTYLTEWLKSAEYNTPQKLVFLPYKGVGGRGILKGVRLHLVLALGDGQTISGEVAAVAAEHRLFQGCDYQMILQPEVLTMVCVKDTQEGEKNVI